MLLHVVMREQHCFTGRAKRVLVTCFGVGGTGSKEAVTCGGHRGLELRNVISNAALRCVALLALVPLVHAGPAINSISPTSGTVGTPITINGSGFGSTQGTSTVAFNGVAGTPTSWNSAQIVVPIPAAATSGTIVVTVGGVNSNGAAFAVIPNIASLSPSSGPVGTAVTISGTGFGSTPGGGGVRFNGTYSPASSWSQSSIVVPVPSGATTGNVVVTTSWGQASNGVTFTVGTGPNITSLSPASGPVGTSVTITGTNFGAAQGSSTVAFNGAAATPSSWSATSIQVPVPSGATTGNVVVTVGGQPSNGVSFTVTTGPGITSLSPTSGPVGTSVTITGTNFGSTQGTSTIKFNGTAATPPSWSATSIVAPVPSGATTGNVVVTVGSQASNGVSFTVTTSAPTITSLTPSWGGGGTSVTITGTNFGATQGTSTVSFHGTNVTPTSWSNTQIVATAAAGNGYVTVTVNGVTSNGIWYPGPYISSISPTSGPIGTSVTITGNDFGTTAGTVTFNGTVTSPTWGNNSITVPVPSGATTGPVVVTSANGPVSNGVTFTVSTTAPSISSLSPTSGPVGTSVTITGSNFGSTQGTSTVTFNGTAATSTSWSATSIGVSVPSSATTGNVVVNVGGQGSNGRSFTVVPQISGLSPGSGSVNASVTINGTGFAATQGTSTVTFNGTTATPTSWSGTSIVAPVPNGATTGNVVVTVMGQASNAASFTVVPAPSINALSPAGAAVGASVTISGSNFGAAQGSGTVTFNGTIATPSSWSATSIIVAVPSGATTGNVVVNASGVSSNPLSFTVLPSPTITSVSPSSGPAGSSVTITGANFGSAQGAGNVTFRGITASVVAWSSTSITVTVPNGAGIGNVVVAASGTSSNGVLFTSGTPSVTSFSPTQIKPGMQMTLTGTGFGAVANDIILNFPQSNHHQEVSTFVSWTDTQIVFTVPNGLEQPGYIYVEQGPAQSNAIQFTTIPPTLTSISPTQVKPGMQMTLTGTNFGTLADAIVLNFPQTNHQKQVSTFVSWTDTQIVFTVPSGLETSPTYVYVDQNGDSSNSLQFTTIPATLTSISPTSIAPGMQLTLTGSGFGTQPQVGFFYGNYQQWVTNLVSGMDTQVVVTVPSGVASGNVTVWQNGVNSNMLAYGVVPPPAISGLSPTSGYPGQTITVTGSNFGNSAAGNSISFNGTLAVPSSWTNTSITVPVPAGATSGNVVVAVSGLNSNPLQFTVTAPPGAISTISPNTAPVGALVTITGTGFGSSGSITFNGVAAAALSWHSTSITAVVPNTTSGNVIVTTGGSSSPGVSFTVSYNIPGTTAVELSYDPVGRVIQRYTCTPSNCGTGQGWQVTQNYDFSGDGIGSSMPGVTFQQPYDAAGRPSQLTSSWVDAQHPATLATVDPSAGYGPNGEIKKMTLGNGLLDTSMLNQRLQPCRMNLNTSNTVLSTCGDPLPSGNFQDFSYGYNLPNTTATDNGNVTSFTGSGQQNFNRTYQYDNLNRLSQMTAPGDACSGLLWYYDPWGNRTAQNASGGTCGQPQTQVDNHNHLLPNPYQYDAAGNLTADGTHTYYYDAENRLIQVDGVLGDCINNPSSPTACYVYDAMGNRVEKNTSGYRGDYLYDVDGRTATVLGNNSLERMYLYIGGKLLAEYFENTTYFVHGDHLGSDRLLSRLNLSDPQGPVRECDDFYPFGELILCGGMTNGTMLKFTGKERDSESNLDNFGFRYFGSSMGRFMSPDEPFYDGDYDDPQKLNLYSYVRNNPLNSIDPDGHRVEICDTNGQNCTSVSNDAYAQAQQQDQYNHAPTLDQLQKTEGESQNITDSNGNVVGTATRINDENAPVEGITPLGESYLGQYALGAGFGRAIGWGWRGIAGLFGRGAENAAADAASETVNLADKKATTHILDGDATGGGHAPGVGIAGKSEFPAGWGRDKIMHEISDVATDPASKVTTAGRSTIVEGTREGVNIRVVIRDGRIVTGYPTNLPRNP